MFDVANVEPFEIDGVCFGDGTMHDPFKRLAVENILLSLSQKEGQYELLNVLVDRVGDAVAAISRLTPDEQKKLLQKLGKNDT